MRPSDPSGQPSSPKPRKDPEVDPGVDLDRFVSGIYNYCDRWCERCPMTAKCYLYWQERQTEAEHRAAGRDPDDWAVVLDDVKKQFEEAIRLLRQAAEEHGWSLDELSPADDTRPDPSDDPLHQRAEAYVLAAHAFLADLRQRVMREHEILEERARVLGPEQAANGYRNILDAHEVVSWYHTLISAKVHRALCSKLAAEEATDEEERAFHGRDALGSARVAHEGVIRSMAALRRVYDWDKNMEDQVIPLLADLDWMRKQIEETFPGVQSFKRPGFDAE